MRWRWKYGFHCDSEIGESRACNETFGNSSGKFFGKGVKEMVRLVSGLRRQVTAGEEASYMFTSTDVWTSRRFMDASGWYLGVRRNAVVAIRLHLDVGDCSE